MTLDTARMLLKPSSRSNVPPFMVMDVMAAAARIEAAGGTEMARGMALALQEVQRPMLVRGISRILLLTDGRTYGDESACVEIARRAQVVAEREAIHRTLRGCGWNKRQAARNLRVSYKALLYKIKEFGIA